MKDCTTCKYGYEDERLGIPMCHHPKRFSEDCVNFNMHEEKEIKESEKPVPNDLEEAAKKYAHCPFTDDDGNFHEDAIDEDAYLDFIAGAKWQEEQDKETIELAEDHAYLAGSVNEREQMMKDAVEGHIVLKNDGWNSIELPSTFFGELSKNYKHGDKVRIIIIKEDER